MNKEVMIAAHKDYKDYLKYVKVSIQWGNPYKKKTFGQFLKTAWGLVKNKYEKATNTGEIVEELNIDFAMF